MALIKCPECGKEISDNAQFCPNCGCPINNWSQERKQNAIEKRKRDLLFSAKILNVCSLLILLCIFAYLKLTVTSSPVPDEGAIVTERNYTMVFGVGAFDTTNLDEFENPGFDIIISIVAILFFIALCILPIVNFVLGLKISRNLSEKLVRTYSMIAGISFVVVLFPAAPLILMTFGLVGVVLLPSILQILASRKYRAALLE